MPYGQGLPYDRCNVCPHECIQSQLWVSFQPGPVTKEAPIDSVALRAKGKHSHSLTDQSKDDSSPVLQDLGAQHWTPAVADMVGTFSDHVDVILLL